MLDIANIQQCARLHKPRLAADYIYRYNINKCYVFDTETSLLKDGQNIYVDTPEFVLGVGSIPNSPLKYFINTNKTLMESELKSAISSGYILVGHNIAFDLNASGIEFLYDKVMIWDTALFEYVVSGQASTFPSLEYTHKKWNKGAGNITSGKIQSVSEAIKTGVEPKDIPHEDLVEYCTQDVNMTKEIFISQFEVFIKFERPYQEMIINQMNWLKNIYNMSKTGLKLDINSVKNSITDMTIDEIKLTANCNYQLENWIMDDAPKGWKPDADINCMSNKQLETVLFGGEIKGYVLEEAGKYKIGSRAGQPKYKKVPYFRLFSKINWGPTVKEGSVDSTNIKAMLDTSPSTTTINFLNNILELRDVSKTKGTYFEGYLKYTDTNGFIHSEMKHVGTPTGRLSSTKPNIQNLKGDE